MNTVASTAPISNNFATISDTCAHITKELYFTKCHVYQLILGF